MALDPFAVNPACRVRQEALFDGHHCLVVDDFLLRPDLAKAFAVHQAPAFRFHSTDNYPGPELRLEQGVWAPVLHWWKQEGRHPFRASRVVTVAHGRLSMVTLPPERLRFSQRLCHTDSPPPGGVEAAAKFAGVLYLFADKELGGTSFYSPEPGFERGILLREVKESGEEALAARYEFFRRPSAYLTTSCEFYRLRHVVAPAYNRAVFYRGDLYHSGHIVHPEKLSQDIRLGRLTANFFLTAAAQYG